MDIGGILDVVKRNGVAKTTRMYIERRQALRAIAKLEGLEPFEWYERMAFERPFAKLHGQDDYRAFMERVLSVEQTLKAQDKARFKKLSRKIKALYIKERIPALYAQLARQPIAERVVFMENGGCPSPSNAHLIDVLQKQGRYEVRKHGLGRGSVSVIEFHENALKFTRDAATAKALFFSTATDVLSHFDVRPETKVIQLWHGLGAFKKIGYSTVDNPHFGRGAKYRAEYDQYRNYSYVTLPSMEQAWVFEEAMRIPVDSGKLVDVGVARTDVFFDDAYREKAYRMLYERFPQAAGRKIILYAPTFRGETSRGRAPDQLDIDALGKAFSDEYVLLVKHHNLGKNPPPLPAQWEDNFAFDLRKNKILSIERLLTIADVLITDYSSVAFEYAILERPMAFFAYDLEDYAEQRGMYYDYEDFVPGPVCRTTAELADYIANLDERFDKGAVAAFKREQVGRCDGHATERTIALIEAPAPDA